MKLKKVRITVLETTLNEKLATQYGAAEFTTCPGHTAGQVLIAENGRRPEGLCEEAWASIGKYVFALAAGADGFWTDWIEKRHVSINSCSDGIRPVIFKLETME